MHIHVYDIVPIDSVCSVLSADNDTRIFPCLIKILLAPFDIDYDKLLMRRLMIYIYKMWL